MNEKSIDSPKPLEWRKWGALAAVIMTFWLAVLAIVQLLSGRPMTINYWVSAGLVPWFIAVFGVYAQANSPWMWTWDDDEHAWIVVAEVVALVLLIATIIAGGVETNNAQDAQWVNRVYDYSYQHELYKPWATFVLGVCWVVPFLVVACLQRATTAARWQIVMAMLASTFVVVALINPIILGKWAAAGCGIAFLVFVISEVIRALFFPAKAPVKPDSK